MKVGANCLRTLAVLLLFAPAVIAQSGYAVVKKFSVSGKQPANAITYDEATGRLFLPSGDEVVVLDAETGAEVGRIQDLAGVHSLVLDPLDHLGMTVNGNSTATLFDPASLDKKENVSLAKKPEFAYFDWNTNRLIAMGEEATVLNPGSGKVIGSIALGGTPLAAADNRLGTIYVAIAGKASLSVVNANQLLVKKEMRVPGCQNPRTIVIDANHQTLLVGCENRKIMVLEEGSGKRFGSWPQCAGVNAMAFDSGEDLIISSCGDGKVTFVQEMSDRSFGSAGAVETETGTLAMVFDQKNQRIFVLGKTQSTGGNSQLIYVLGRPTQ